MILTHIELDKLSISTLNMRHGRKAPDLSDILPSIRARGVLVPILVRPNGSPDTFEIVAGRRRYFAAKTVSEEGGPSDSLPCAVLEADDDASALEASLIENIARLDPDEVTQWETFTRLVKEGRSVEAIAATFGITELMVKRSLALGNLLPRIRDLYRRDEIDAGTVRHLTLASKSQQKAWLALFDDPKERPPRGFTLKQWLFGGNSIATGAAIFPIETYEKPIVADLFGEEAYFSDADLFWTLQTDAIEARRAACLDAGWRDVIVLERGEMFHAWEFQKTGKRKGGKVFIEVSHRGEVTFHEGYLGRKEAARRRSGEAESEAPAEKTARPEMTSGLANYVDLHRHAAVRVSLLDHPGVALRLMLAHVIHGAGLWRVAPEPQRAASPAIAASLAASPSEAVFAARRREAAALLGIDVEDDPLVQFNGDDHDMAALFLRLLRLSDTDVGRVLAVVMGETLASGTAVIEALGVHLKTGMADVWQADDAFFDLLRDREVTNAMLAEVAGPEVAHGNRAVTAKVQKQIIRDCLAGTNGRDKAEGWLPRWMTFPPRAYTERGGCPMAERWVRVGEQVAHI